MAAIIDNSNAFNTATWARVSQLSEAIMLELLGSLIFAVVMVPIFIAVILGLIWGLGEVFNVLSNIGHSKESRNQQQQEQQQQHR